MNTEKDRQAADELAEIKEEMRELLDRALVALKGTSEEDRARSYWYAHMRCALDDDHGYLGGSMVTMQDSIDALGGREDD